MHGQTKTVLWGNNMYIMTPAPEKGEEPCLPHGLYIANTYTKMTTGSKCVDVVIKNQIDALITINKGVKIARVEVKPGTLEKLNEIQGIWQTKMLIEWRKEMLLQQLDLSGLEVWPRTKHTSAHTLLTKYHNIFLLEPRELGCTSLAKH